MSQTDSDAVQRGPRGPAALSGLIVAALLLFTGFIALGTWQVHRLAWKRDLIARVDRRVHAAPVAPPASAQWNAINAAADEYRHVRLTGVWLSDRRTLVRASTDAWGPGFWLMTPLRQADGTIVLVNRGFISPTGCARANTCAASPTGAVTVTGLMRMTEPHGAFLRRNDPLSDHWYSRDVQAIARARGLSNIAPYFVDADAASDAFNEHPDRGPVGGMTVISFPNNHLQYAITWYVLAFMVLVGAWLVGREERRLRHVSR